MTKMKDSGVKWIGQIPEEWELIQNRYLFEYTGKKVGEEFSKYQLLSLTTKGVKERDINDANGKVPESYDNYQTVKKGQMIFCLFDLDCSAVFSGISNFDGMITSAYNVYSATKLADSRYMDYWFQYVFSDRYYKIYSKNVRFTISEETFKSIETPVPPLNAQKNIADFLDKKCGEIDRLIEIQEQEIENLKEYKISVIDGIYNKNCNEKVRIKYLIDGICDGTHGSYERVQDGEMLLSAKNLGEENLIITENESMISIEDYNEIIKNGYPKKNDILVCCVGDIGKTLLYEYDKIYAFQRSVLFLRPSNKITPKFLLYALRSSFVKQQEQKLMNKTIQAGLYQGLVKQIKIFYDSNIENQKKIVEIIEKEVRILDKLIVKKQQKIEKLREYKKSLIYEYVTGKKEVV